jgi:hypothetical protein
MFFMPKFLLAMLKLEAMSSCCCNVRLLSFLLVIALAPVSAYLTSSLEGSLVLPG